MIFFPNGEFTSARRWPTSLYPYRVPGVVLWPIRGTPSPNCCYDSMAHERPARMTRGSKRLYTGEVFRTMWISSAYHVLRTHTILYPAAVAISLAGG